MWKSPQNLAGARSRRLWVYAAVLVAVAVTGVVLFFFDPAKECFYPPCMFHKLTSLNCPGCGGLRALHHLTHGHFAQALHCNALVVLSLPVLLAARAHSLWRKKVGAGQPRVSFQPVSVWLILGLMIAFGILRNLPSPLFACLSP
jgi:cytochrome b subunit of formate dehydrogenase